MLQLSSDIARSDGRSPHARLRNRCRALALLLVALLGGVPLAGQEVVSLDPLEMDPLPVEAHDLQYSLPSTTYCDGCDNTVDACRCGGIPWPRFGMYLKAGPSFQLGNGLFEESTKVGYEISFGGREPLLPTNRQVFFDFGGSYLSAFGRGQPFTVSGVIERTGGLGAQRLDEFLDLTLQEISRASVHVAVGWNYDFSEVPEVSRLFTMRFGGRLSHIHGHFREDPTEALRAAIDTAEALGVSFTLAKDQLISQTDTAPGIFAGIEWAHTRPMGRGATISYLLDGEFASDWIDLKNYADSSLVTATLLLGVSVNR